jgi:diacylglycerol kinase (ATP)
MPDPHPQLAGERVIALLSAANVIRLEELKRLLGQVFPLLDIIAPRDLTHLGEIVRRSHSTHRVLLSVGGDGMLHHVLQNIDVARQILGLVPAGTGNDVAREIGYPKPLRAAIAHLGSLQARPTDFGKVNEYRFINSAGFGLDSETLRVRNNSRGLLHRNYLAAYVYVLARLRAFACQITIDGDRLDGRWYWVLAMNTPFIGGGTRIAPRAVMDDGLLDVMLIKDTAKLDLLRHMPATIKGQHLGLDIVVYRQARELICQTEKPLNMLAVDGEQCICAGRDVRIQVQAGQLSFLR